MTATTALTFERAAALLADARTRADVFGVDDPAGVFRSLAKVVHSRRGTRSWRPRRAEGGRDPGVRHAGPAVGAVPRRRAADHAAPDVHDGSGRRDVANLVELSWMDGRALLKAEDNDLLMREATALRRLERDGPRRHRAYVPRLIERFTHREKGIDRAASIPAIHGAESIPSRIYSKPDL